MMLLRDAPPQRLILVLANFIRPILLASSRTGLGANSENDIE